MSYTECSLAAPNTHLSTSIVILVHDVQAVVISVIFIATFVQFIICLFTFFGFCFCFFNCCILLKKLGKSGCQEDRSCQSTHSQWSFYDGISDSLLFCVKLYHPFPSDGQWLQWEWSQWFSWPEKLSEVQDTGLGGKKFKF